MDQDLQGFLDALAKCRAVYDKSEEKPDLGAVTAMAPLVSSLSVSLQELDAESTRDYVIALLGKFPRQTALALMLGWNVMYEDA